MAGHVRSRRLRTGRLTTYTGRGRPPSGGRHDRLTCLSGLGNSANPAERRKVGRQQSIIDSRRVKQGALAPAPSGDRLEYTCSGAIIHEGHDRLGRHVIQAFGDPSGIVPLDHRDRCIVQRGNQPDGKARSNAAHDRTMPQGIGNDTFESGVLKGASPRPKELSSSEPCRSMRWHPACHLA